FRHDGRGIARRWRARRRDSHLSLVRDRAAPVRPVGRTARPGDCERASATRGRSGGTAPDGGACGRVRSGTIRLGRDRAGDVAPLRRAALIVSIILLTPNLSGTDGISMVA